LEERVFWKGPVNILFNNCFIAGMLLKQLLILLGFINLTIVKFELSHGSSIVFRIRIEKEPVIKDGFVLTIIAKESKFNARKKLIVGFFRN